ncbi:hypothetical protein BJX99DRAFT_266076 [Aspergillus californicus]
MKLILTAALAHLAIPSIATIVTIPNVLTNGTVTAESISVPGNLDAPRLSPPAANLTSYDWWYFDAVSTTDNAAVSIIFFNSGANGFSSRTGAPVYATITGLFPNGTSFDTGVDATPGAIIDYGDDYIFANWTGSGMSFRGTNLTGVPEYQVTIDSPDIGVYGTMTLRSRAPPHYPCGPNKASEQEQLVPHVFWANMIPDATTTVNLRINGAPITFTDGVGYHDKNWGDAPFAESVSSWYWGHANLGPYSIVWFDAIDSAGEEHHSGYVSRDGVFSGGCSDVSAVVRPWGGNSTYPPLVSTGVMQGLGVVFDLGVRGVFVANVTTGRSMFDTDTYVRTIGTVVGGMVGWNESFGGVALFEEFKYETS